MLDAHVHTHQRFAASAYVLAGGVEDFPYVPPLPAPYAPAVVDRPALDALRARLLAEPALRFASSRPGLDVVAAGDGAAPGVYDRHAELGRAPGEPWVLADGDRVTAVFLDDYGAAAAAAGRAPAPGDFSASMAGLVAGDAAVSPQHYILRLTLAALEGESGSGPLRRCCVQINRRFGTSRPNSEILELGHIEVDSADFWTHRWLSSSSRSTADVSKPSNTLTLNSSGRFESHAGAAAACPRS